MFYSDGRKEQTRYPTTSAYGMSWHTNICTTSSFYNTYYVGFRAFDRNLAEPGWVSDEAYILGSANGINNIDNVYGEYITLELQEKIFITSYTITARIYDGSRPSKWFLLGWNSDTGYETIHNQNTQITDTDWESATNLTMSFNVNPTKKIKIYILVVTDVTDASTHLGFCELYFMGGNNYSGTQNLEIDLCGYQPK